MPGVSRYPEEAPLSDLDSRVATLEGIIRQRFLEGAGQIDNGNSVEVIAHGLGVVPSSLFVTPFGNTLIWVDSVNATTFRVNRSGTSGDRGFYWLAIP